MNGSDGEDGHDQDGPDKKRRRVAPQGRRPLSCTECKRYVGRSSSYSKISKLTASPQAQDPLLVWRDSVRNPGGLVWARLTLGHRCEACIKRGKPDGCRWETGGGEVCVASVSATADRS